MRVTANLRPNIRRHATAHQEVVCRGCCVSGIWAHYKLLLEAAGLFVLFFLSYIYLCQGTLE